MEAQQFIDRLIEGVMSFVDVEREALADFLRDQGIVEATQHFIATGQPKQLDVLRFRVTTQARKANVHAIRQGSDIIGTLIGFGGGMLIDWLGPQTEPVEPPADASPPPSTPIRVTRKRNTATGEFE